MKLTNLEFVIKQQSLRIYKKYFFPRIKKTYFTEIYDAIESKLISTNYLMLHGLLSFRNNIPCYICGKYEDNLDHLLFQCPFLSCPTYRCLPCRGSGAYARSKIDLVNFCQHQTKQNKENRSQGRIHLLQKKVEKDSLWRIYVVCFCQQQHP